MSLVYVVCCGMAEREEDRYAGSDQPVQVFTTDALAREFISARREKLKDTIFGKRVRYRVFATELDPS